MSVGVLSFGYSNSLVSGWSLMPAGPGGNIIGVNFANDGTGVCRTDTGGCYVNTISNPVWSELITTSAFPSSGAILMGSYAAGGIAFGGTYAVAVAPNNSQVIYVFAVDGKIYASSNQGSSFAVTGFTPVSISVNGAFDNSFNDKLAVDPQNAAVVVAGCPSGTFFNTTSGAGSWTQISSVGTGSFASLIAFDPSSTVTSGKTQGVYIGTYGTGIYHSSTGLGGTFTLLNSTGMPTNPLSILCSSDGFLYVTQPGNTGTISIWNGSSWSTAHAYVITPSDFIRQAVPDPNTTGRVVAVFSQGTVSESLDHGTTWVDGTPLIPIAGTVRVAPADVPWLATCNHSIMAGGTSRFNPAVSNTLHFNDGISNWTINPYIMTSSTSFSIGTTGNTSFTISNTQSVFSAPKAGDAANLFSSANTANQVYSTVVSYTPTTGTTGTLVLNVTSQSGSGTHADWTIRCTPRFVSQGAGINQLVGNSLISPTGGKPFFTAWDRCGLYLGSTTAFPANQAFVNPGGTTTEIVGGWAVDWSATTPTYLAGIFNSNIATYDTSGFSTDGGQTWTAFTNNTPWGSGSFISGSIAVAGNATSSASTQNIVWMPAGFGGGGNNPYFTTNGGSSWTACSFPVAVPTTGTTGWGGFNTAPNIKQVCADRVANNTFYAANSQTKSVYTSTNSGSTWTKVSGASTLNITVIQCVPKLGTTNTTGWLFGAGYATDNFNRSKDGGATWSSVSGFTTVAGFGFGASVNGAVPAYLVVGINSGVRGVWLSIDDGVTWKNVTSGFVSADQISDCDGDKSTSGLWYVLTQNTGVYQGVNIS